MNESLSVHLNEIESDHHALVGGKAKGLGELNAHNFPVPPGFVLTVDAYHRNVNNGISEKIRPLLDGLDENTDNRAVAEKIRALFLEQGLDQKTESVIRTAYAELGCDVPVAVRSSATMEDAPDASFAGQQQTFLWICGADQVCHHVVECWASLFSAEAIGYRARFGIETGELAMAVVIQQMVDAVSAGVMFTLDPGNGDRDTVYIESAHGLGEVVVRGEVSPDRFHFDKNSGKVRGQIGVKRTAYRFDTTAGEVRKLAVMDNEAHKTSLTEEEAGALAELGLRVEKDFGRPMDIEWAMDTQRNIYLLQARPETVWSRRPTRQQVEAVIGRHDDWDPLNQDSDPHQYWTTVNTGEALPGVQTPLSWTTWDSISDLMINDTFYRMGVISKKERTLPPLGQRKNRIFYGRAAADITLFTTPGDRIPGSSGKQIAEHIFGYVPDDLESKPDRSRWPIIFVKTPMLALGIEKRLRRAVQSTDLWWKEKIAEIPSLDKQSAIELYTEARQRVFENIRHQSSILMCSVQPMYQVLEKLVKKTGIGSASALAGGYGDVPEVAVVHDLWRASRGECTLEEVIYHHGYHGPMEGELSVKVWRENPSSLRKMLAGYAARGGDASPIVRDEKRRKEREKMEAAMVAAVPRWQQPLIRWLLNLAARKIPLRGEAKNAFIQCFDVARAAARRAGECLSAEGILENPDDVFMLTMDELEADPKIGVAELVAKRKARRECYMELTLPTAWQGRVTPRFITDPLPKALSGDSLTGIGVSAGIVEGRVRVVLKPDFAEVEPDEILVAPTTDPSWSSIMFISAGLVVDIGGAMSHAAVVARELGIPCVVNCLTGTKVFKTGDVIRVDGGAGTIELLQRAEGGFAVNRNLKIAAQA